MKYIAFVFALFSSISIGIKGQSKQFVSIKGASISCDGDSLVLTAVPSNIGIELNCLWTSKPSGVNASGNEIKIKTDIASMGKSFQVYLKAFVEKDDNTSVVYDTLEITIEPKPYLIAPITSFQKGNDVFLEAKSVPQETYVWESPNNLKVNGNIGKYADIRQSDFGKFQLTVTNAVSGCKNEFEYELNREEDSQVKNVFGSIDDVEIAPLLYKEVLRDVPVYECKITGEDKASNFVIGYPGYQFTIIGQIDDDYIIRFWKWNESKKTIKRILASHAIPLEIGQTGEENSNSFVEYEVSGNTIIGNVRNPDSREAISGATIREVSENRSVAAAMTITDDQGNFRLTVDKIPTQITFSNIGMQKGIVTITQSPSPEAPSFEPVKPEAKQGLNDKYVLKKRDSFGQDDFRYFRIKKSDVDSRTLSFAPIKGKSAYSFTAGTILIPVKIRRSEDLNDGGFEFSKDIALGPFIGFKRRVSKYKPFFINAGISVGISSVRISADNSNPDRTSTVQDLAAFTRAIGLVLEFDKVQMGFFVGKDQINNNYDSGNPDDPNAQKGYHWAYQNKTWWSIGFGYSLFNRPEKGKSARNGGPEQP